MFDSAVFSTGDTVRWMELLEGLDLRDPHYLPGYVQIYGGIADEECRAHFGGEGMLFYFGDGDNYVLYPFLKRSIRELPFADESTKDLYDIVSPYGYGGPLARIRDKSICMGLWTGFFDKFGDYCKQNNIVSEFCRLHPVFENHKPVAAFSRGITRKAGGVVYSDLERSEEEIWAGMSKPHRRRARRAAENTELDFSLDIQEGHPQSFFALYTETMRRHDAHPRYFFPPSFFATAFRGLGEHMSFPHVVYRDVIVTAMLVLRYGDVAYSWLSGAKPDYFHLYSGNVLMYRTLLESKRSGVKCFVLGGGVSAERDSVFDFKAGFSSLFRDFYVYEKVHIREEYWRLTELRETWDQYSTTANDGFFPQYRSPKLDERHQLPNERENIDDENSQTVQVASSKGHTGVYPGGLHTI